MLNVNAVLLTEPSSSTGMTEPWRDIVHCFQAIIWTDNFGLSVVITSQMITGVWHDESVTSYRISVFGHCICWTIKCIIHIICFLSAGFSLIFSWLFVSMVKLSIDSSCFYAELIRVFYSLNAHIGTDFHTHRLNEKH